MMDNHQRSCQVCHNCCYIPFVDVQCACKQQNKRKLLVMNPKKIDALNQNCLGIIEVGSPISMQSQAQLEDNKKKGKRKMQGSNHIVNEVRSIQKPRQPNQENHEVVALVEAKRDEHINSLDMVNFKDNFESVTNKWKKISTSVMGANQNIHMKNGHACKEKSTIIFDDYKNICNYMVVIDHNEEFWKIILVNRMAFNLPQLFNKIIYEMINAFIKNMPIF